MARPHVPKFGNWASGDNAPYTIYFDKARESRNTGKMINPNDPQEYPELFAKITPQTEPKPPPPRLVTEPEEPIVRGQVRPTQEHRRSKENGEFRQFVESPARNENMNRRGAHGGGREPNSVRPVRQSVGSEHSFEKSPLNPHHQAKVATKVGNSSPSWDGKSSYESSHGTPDRARIRPANRGRETPDRGAAVPKFGEWDEKNPSSGDGYTHIFNKVREERQTGSDNSPKRVYEPSYPPRQKYNDDEMKSCCFPWGRK